MATLFPSYLGVPHASTVDATLEYESLLYNPHQTMPELLFEVGYCIVAQQFVVYLTNGCIANLSLLSITSTGALGIDIIEGDAPATILPRESRKIVFDLTLDGPLLFDALFTITTNQGNRFVRFRGQRAPTVSDSVDIFLEHNWINGLTERREWKTDILTAYDRTEQRIQLRDSPRRFYNFSDLKTGTDKQYFDTLFMGRAYTWYLIPMWHEVTPVTTPVTAGATTIFADVSKLEYTPERPIYIFYGDVKSRLDIQSVAVDSITLLTTVTQDYPMGSYIVSANYFRHIENPKFLYNTNTLATPELSMLGFYTDELSDVHYTADVYNTWDVLPIDIHFESVSTTTSFHETKYDNGNIIETVVKSQEPYRKRTLTMKALDRNEIYTLICFLYTLKGRLRSFWAPTYTDDITITTNILATDTQLTINNIDYNLIWFGSYMRSFIEVRMHNGTIYRREITAAQAHATDTTLEFITIDSAFGVDITPDDISTISFFELVRLDTDTLTFNWQTSAVLQVQLPVVTLHAAQGY